MAIPGAKALSSTKCIVSVRPDVTVSLQRVSSRPVPRGLRRRRPLAPLRRAAAIGPRLHGAPTRCLMSSDHRLEVRDLTRRAISTPPVISVGSAHSSGVTLAAPRVTILQVPYAVKVTHATSELERSVKENDLDDAKKIALLIESGTATKRDVLALLMYVREELPNGMVKDLAHSVAHTSRDRGYAFNRIEKFVSHMISVFQKGGTLKVEPIFEANPLIKELSKELGRLGIPLRRSITYRHREALFAAIEELLVGVTLELTNPNVTTCTFERLNSDDPDTFCFVVRTRGLSNGAITMPENVGTAFPLFSPLTPRSTPQIPT